MYTAATSPKGLAAQMTSLWSQQAQSWPMLTEGLAGLRQARTRSFHLDSSRVVAQCNASRHRSASAKVDARSIAERRCFLCPDHLPVEQRRIVYRDRWLILCNPAPLFEPHYTISTIAHEPQRVGTAVGVMLELVRDLGGQYTVFYNGPRCGASAPDHLHLQAGPVGATPFEAELATGLGGGPDQRAHRWIEWLRTGRVRLGASRPSHRPVLIFVSDEQAELAETLAETIAAVGEVHPAEPEPMLNLFATFADDRWIVWLFPRAAHRPAAYGESPEDYLISPGAVDLAGLLITPRPADFDRLEPRTVQGILNEVLLSPGTFARLRDRLRPSR